MIHGELTVPIRDVLVGNARSNIEHDNATLSVDVVSVSQTTELFLTSCVPDIKVDLAEVLKRRFSEVNTAQYFASRTVVNPKG